MKYMRNNGCGCAAGRPAACPVTASAASTECVFLPVMAFVQPQVWDCTYTCGQALAKGTLFPALDKPFMGKGGCCNG